MATSGKNIARLCKRAEYVFFAILFILGGDVAATPTQVTWNSDTLWSPTINCSLSNPACSFQINPVNPSLPTNIYSTHAPLTYDLTDLSVSNETLIIRVDSYPTLDNIWDSNTIKTLHKWLEIRETNCSGTLVATRDMPSGTTNLPNVGYSRFDLVPVPVTPGHTYGLCLHYDPMPIPQGFQSYNDHVSFYISNGGIVDIPPISTTAKVPALPWQSEMLFATCLLAAGRWIDHKQKPNKPKKGYSDQRS